MILLTEMETKDCVKLIEVLSSNKTRCLKIIFVSNPPAHAVENIASLFSNATTEKIVGKEKTCLDICRHTKYIFIFKK